MPASTPCEPHCPFNSMSGTVPAYSAHAGVEFQPASNLSLSFGVGFFSTTGAHRQRHQFVVAVRIERIPIESDQGFCYSIELLVKAHRLGWPVREIPAVWFERKFGTSQFRVLRWLPAYLRWFKYAFAITFLRRSPETVVLFSEGLVKSKRSSR